MKPLQLAVFLLLAGFLCAQGPEPMQTLKLQTRVVGIAAVVRDRKGNAVTGLGQDDFQLTEDDMPQPIHYFSQGALLPLTLTLMVDTSISQNDFLHDETKASEVFFQSMLQHPYDRAALVQFDWNVIQLQYMTNSADDLEHALGHLPDPHPSLLPGKATGTMLYDAVWRVSLKTLGHQNGRRIMVILTDGVDNGSSKSLTEAIVAAQRNDVVVYSVLYSATPAHSLFPTPATSFALAGRNALRALSESTGGRVFEVSRRMTLAKIYAEIIEDTRAAYQVGYNPPEAAPNQYHRIRLTAKDPGNVVQAREGYYSPR